MNLKSSQYRIIKWCQLITNELFHLYDTAFLTMNCLGLTSPTLSASQKDMGMPASAIHPGILNMDALNVSLTIYSNYANVTGYARDLKLNQT